MIEKSTSQTAATPGELSQLQTNVEAVSRVETVKDEILSDEQMAEQLIALGKTHSYLAIIMLLKKNWPSVENQWAQAREAYEALKGMIHIVILALIVGLFSTGCATQDFGGTLAGEVNYETIQGLYGHLKMSSPSANAMPDMTGGIGNVQVFRSPIFASTNGVMKTESPMFASGAGASQALGSSLTGGGTTYFVLGKMSVFITTNVVASPATNYPSPQSGETAK